ncbi:MAG: hypothetical protein CUN55_12810, partial [Phototrophicales bacterium]
MKARFKTQGACDALSDAELELLATYCDKKALGFNAQHLLESVKVEQIKKGANSQVKKIDIGSDSLIVKKYYRSDEDSRDRFQAEWSFTRFLWQQDVRQVAEPLACIKQDALAAYKFITGQPITEALAEHVSDALQFLAQINQHRALAKNIGFASEAGVSAQHYIDGLNARVERLMAQDIKSEVDRQARSFVKARLAPRAQSLIKDINFDVVGEYCLSPSDYGFHNALATEQGTYFFDFEYAGWGDPAKLVADFLLQPQVSLSKAYYHSTIRSVCKWLDDPDAFLNRLPWVLKWAQLK